MLTLRKIENVPTGPNNRPKLAVKITGMIMVSASEKVIYWCYFRMWRDVGAGGVWSGSGCTMFRYYRYTIWRCLKLRSRKNGASEFYVMLLIVAGPDANSKLSDILFTVPPGFSPLGNNYIGMTEN